MRRFLAPLAVAAAVLLAVPAHAATQMFGPQAYLSQADSPFNPANFSSFVVEDMEDGLFNLAGVSKSNGTCVTNAQCFVGGFVDSVGNGGDESKGHSLFGRNSISISFNAAILGVLPKAAGLVWTDGANAITFEAFDGLGNSLGILTGNHADGRITGELAEDRFYGVISDTGISRMVISNPGGIEIDHIQYGLAAATAAVPEPASWAMMIGGFGLVGGAMRLRRKTLAFT